MRILFLYLSIPFPGLTANATAICSGDTALLSATADISGGDYDWYQDGVQIDTTASIEVTPTVTSDYTVVYTSPAQCENSTHRDGLFL